jgi:hypothetical protein
MQVFLQCCQPFPNSPSATLFRKNESAAEGFIERKIFLFLKVCGLLFRSYDFLFFFMMYNTNFAAGGSWAGSDAIARLAGTDSGGPLLIWAYF